MKKIYHLSTCDTCRKILGSIDILGADLINIREENIDKEALQNLKNEVGSYEALFNKRAQKLKTMAESEKPKKDLDYKRLILSDYTFLKRPVIICEKGTFVGNEKKTVDALLEALPKKKN